MYVCTPVAQQGVPIPFAVDIAPGGDLGLGPIPATGHAMPFVSPSKAGPGGVRHKDLQQRAFKGGHYSKSRAQSGGAVGSPGKGRNSLNHELGKVRVWCFELRACVVALGHQHVLL